ncbi:magnesium transporter [Parabacteroides sp. OttesenSCG-928-G07]|nr:magnesium transporter [Parabacteroides sp. OttesenSCG-928-G21]MDL2277116.1 magnesium transporter [Parabacteroides sp. OttesenSCG-928-G07]
MDYRKINSHIILLSIVLLVGVTISMIGRRIMLEKGFDAGTANLTFVIILGICIIAYLVIIATLAHVIFPWIEKKILKKKKTKAIVPPENTLNEKEEMPEISIEEIRQNANKFHIEEQNDKINLFLEYSHLTMAPYLTDDELLHLDEYIRYYVKEDILPDNLIPIKPDKLKNPDMFHFGWNMAHYFGNDKQDVVPWLQAVFFGLKELSFSTIKGKLYDYQTQKYKIPNIDNIHKYMSERKS